MRISTIFGTKMAHLSWTKIFWYKPLLLVSSIYWPFSLWKIYKNSYSWSRIMTMHHFWAQNGPFAIKKIFLESYYDHSHLPISPFHCAKFKKDSSSRSRIMSMCNFSAQNGPFPQNANFFRKPVHEPSFFYSCLSICQKSKSVINLLEKYWWLKNTEVSLTKSHFCL